MFSISQHKHSYSDRMMLHYSNVRSRKELRNLLSDTGESQVKVLVSSNSADSRLPSSMLVMPAENSERLTSNEKMIVMTREHDSSERFGQTLLLLGKSMPLMKNHCYFCKHLIAKQIWVVDNTHGTVLYNRNL